MCLYDLENVGAAFGATLNQVVLAAVTQTLRSYLEIHGGVPDVPLVAAIPVSARPDETACSAVARVRARRSPAVKKNGQITSALKAFDATSPRGT
ncbi:MAG TPA: hypothetical protein VMS55_23990 [Myxococcota bacterium]|nr:hypothetical protein [Myxococcota bacterium]